MSQLPPHFPGVPDLEFCLQCFHSENSITPNSCRVFFTSIFTLVHGINSPNLQYFNRSLNLLQIRLPLFVLVTHPQLANCAPMTLIFPAVLMVKKTWKNNFSLQFLFSRTQSDTKKVVPHSGDGDEEIFDEMWARTLMGSSGKIVPQEESFYPATVTGKMGSWDLQN